VAEQDAEYERMKRLLGIFFTDAMGHPADSPANPLNALAAIAEKQPAAARKGLAMAINDIVEMSNDQPPDYVRTLDAHLTAQGAMTLSEARARFSKRLKAILRRGTLKDETEYYLARNAVDLAAPEDAARLQAMIGAFESAVVALRE
jgi:tryptophan 2,3-dioxygenase